ncbi:MAG: hypothetical protein ACXW4C_11935, partial [Nitrospira sp.]
DIRDGRQTNYDPCIDVLENQARLKLDDLYLFAVIAGLDVPHSQDELHVGAGVLKVRRDLLSGNRSGVQGPYILPP